MSKLEEIEKRLSVYEDKNVMFSAMVKRQLKLQKLVILHGVENVCIAGGYTKSTLLQYLRTNNPNIGKEKLDKALHILKNL